MASSKAQGEATGFLIVQVIVMIVAVMAPFMVVIGVSNFFQELISQIIGVKLTGNMINMIQNSLYTIPSGRTTVNVKLPSECKVECLDCGAFVMPSPFIPVIPLMVVNCNCEDDVSATNPLMHSSINEWGVVCSDMVIKNMNIEPVIIFREHDNSTAGSYGIKFTLQPHPLSDFYWMPVFSPLGAYFRGEAEIQTTSELYLNLYDYINIRKSLAGYNNPFGYSFRITGDNSVELYSTDYWYHSSISPPANVQGGARRVQGLGGVMDVIFKVCSNMSVDGTGHPIDLHNEALYYLDNNFTILLPPGYRIIKASSTVLCDEYCPKMHSLSQMTALESAYCPDNEWITISCFDLSRISDYFNPLSESYSCASFNYNVGNLCKEQVYTEILYYSFESVSESTSMILDGSGFGNHALMTYKPSANADTSGPQIINNPSECIKGACIKFDGYNDYLRVLNKSVGDFRARNFIIDFWMKSEDKTQNDVNGGINQVLVSKGNSSYEQNWTVRNYSDNYLAYHNHNIFTNLSKNVFDKRWHHVTLEKKGNTVYLSVDGELVNRTHANYLSMGANNQLFLTLGAGNQGSDEFFSGYIDEFRILERRHPDSCVGDADLNNLNTFYALYNNLIPETELRGTFEYDDDYITITRDDSIPFNPADNAEFYLSRGGICVGESGVICETISYYPTINLLWGGSLIKDCKLTFYCDADSRYGILITPSTTLSSCDMARDGLNRHLIPPEGLELTLTDRPNELIGGLVSGSVNRYDYPVIEKFLIKVTPGPSKNIPFYDTCDDSVLDATLIEIESSLRGVVLENLDTGFGIDYPLNCNLSFNSNTFTISMSKGNASLLYDFYAVG